MRKSKIDQRREHVKEYVNNSPKTDDAVKELSDKLFLSERTIYRDLGS